MTGYSTEDDWSNRRDHDLAGIDFGNFPSTPSFVVVNGISKALDLLGSSQAKKGSLYISQIWLSV